MDRYTISLSDDKREFLYPEGEWVLYKDAEHELDLYKAINIALDIDNKEKTNKIASLQAKIDALMLEYCPEDMTKEQMAEYELHQEIAPITDTMFNKLKANAIREMVETVGFFSNHAIPAGLIKAYISTLEKQK